MAYLLRPASLGILISKTKEFIMTDEIKEDGAEQSSTEAPVVPEKKPRGFACPENRKNIANGRPRGAKNKVMSDADFTKAIMAKEGIILERILKIVKEGKDSDALKVGIKWMEWSIKIRENGGMLLTKDNEDGSKTEYEAQEKATGTNGNVVEIKRLSFIDTQFKED